MESDAVFFLGRMNHFTCSTTKQLPFHKKNNNTTQHNIYNISNTYPNSTKTHSPSSSIFLSSASSVLNARTWLEKLRDAFRPRVIDVILEELPVEDTDVWSRGDGLPPKNAPLDTNIAPEKCRLEDEFLIEMIPFQATCSFSGGFHQVCGGIVWCIFGGNGTCWSKKS